MILFFFSFTKNMRLITYIQTRHQISRRNFVSLVKQGCIFINGKKIDSYTQEVISGDKVKIKSPKLTIEEMIQEVQKKSTLILLNKPMGYVASKSDPHNKTIYELLPPEYINYYYIWRLDKDSHWLLLLTDDPALVNEFEHPKFDIEKEYDVELDIELEPKDIQRALSGVKDEDEMLRALKIERIKGQKGASVQRKDPSISTFNSFNSLAPHYRIILNEWKKRHIRRMFKTIGYRVMDLKRVREGKYSLGDLKVGEWKIVK